MELLCSCSSTIDVMLIWLLWYHFYIPEMLARSHMWPCKRNYTFHARGPAVPSHFHVRLGYARGAFFAIAAFWVMNKWLIDTMTYDCWLLMLFVTEWIIQDHCISFQLCAFLGDFFEPRHKFVDDHPFCFWNSTILVLHSFAEINHSFLV